MKRYNDIKVIEGIHHITAIADSAVANHRFYTEVLGLRMVKQTVNFDDPHTYHLYYGDDDGRPGTLITFFPWEGMQQGRQGAGQITAVAFAIPPDSVDYWLDRLAAYRIRARTETRFGDRVIGFFDPHGMPLELVATADTAGISPWPHSPVSPGHFIRGFHSATATLNALPPTRNLLSETLGMTPVDREDRRYRFCMADGSANGGCYDILVDPRCPAGRMGGGTVHHIAWRTPSDETQEKWRQKIHRHGLGVTPIIDRQYFRSIYFREPGGVLFEIATDPPGFAVDEKPAQLGTGLKLPPQYESRRAEIENQLPRLNAAVDMRYEIKAPHTREPAAGTLLTLHGTGGNERDLFPFAREIVGDDATLLGLRGNVSENGMPRFFRRLAEGVFDEGDVRRRTHEVADFIGSVARKHALDTHKLTALGYSNGANMAAALMMLRPEVFRQALLLRPMLPLTDTVDVDLTGIRVLIVTGRYDRTIPSRSSQALIRRLRELGADVNAVELEADHGLTREDVRISQQWLASPPMRKDGGKRVVDRNEPAETPV